MAGPENVAGHRSNRKKAWARGGRPSYGAVIQDAMPSIFAIRRCTLMGKSLDVFCVADMCVDLVLEGNVRPAFHQVEQIIDHYILELGGSANIFATQFAKIGGRAGVAGWVGPDAFGEFVLARLQGISVDTTHVHRHDTLKTGLGVALAERHDRAILTYLGTIDAFPPHELTGDLLAATRHWHIASYFLLGKLRRHWKGWLERCRAEKLTASLDTNWDPENRWEGVMEILPLVDVFLPNQAEAQAIAGEADLCKAGERLAGYGPLVVIKRGSEGAVAFRGKQRWWSSPSEHSPSPIRIVDTIGAGDNFDAGFLRAWLLGREVDQCLDLASRCAASSLGAAGGIEGQLRETVE